MDLEDRKRQLASFSSFINESYSRIDEILSNVGWTREYLEKENAEMVVCPLNAEHTMPKTSLDAHLKSCAWRKEEYDSLDIPLPENCAYPESMSTITIDTSQQAAIIKEAKKLDPLLTTGNLANDRLIPKTSDRLMADFTTDERRILYDYIVSKTTPVEDVKMEDLQMIGDMKKDEKPRPKSKLELLIEERDAKRRRISYRKKVHTNRKSHTEIMHEVIQNQMELLEQIIKGECTEDNDEKCTADYKEVNAGDIHVQKNPISGDIVGSSVDKRSVTDEHKKGNHREPAKCYSEEYVDHEAERKNDKSDAHEDVLSEKSINSKRDSEWNEKKNHKEHRIELKTFDKRYSEERRHYEEGTNWERKGNHRDYNRRQEDHYYYQSKRMHDESGSYSESKYYRNSTKYENVSEQNNDKYSHSRHYRNFSKHSERYVEYEKEYYSHSRYQKNVSKHETEHDLKYEKEYAVSRSCKRKYSPYNEYEQGESRDSYGNYKNQRYKNAEDTSVSMSCIEFDKRSQHSNKKTNTEEYYQRNEILSHSQKNFEESKRMKMKKKKKKKHHKHKSKKKSNKKKNHSDSSSSSSSESNSDSESP